MADAPDTPGNPDTPGSPDAPGNLDASGSLSENPQTDPPKDLPENPSGDPAGGGAVSVTSPRVPEIPLVFDSPHSGSNYPEDFVHLPPQAAMRQAEDAFVDEIYAAAPEHGAVLIGALFPRIYIDPNRSLRDIDPELLDGAWPGPVDTSRKSELGLGLIWRLCPPGEPIYDRKLSVDEVRHRIDAYWRPYHAAVSDSIDRLHRKFGRVWHVNCHSMRAVGGVMSEDGPGTHRTDIVLGDRDGTTCSGEFTELVRETLVGLGYAVAVNDPYKGVELVRAYSDPARERHSLQIEINRKLYMDEKRLTRTGNFATLQGDITRMIAVIAGHASQSAA